jgi:hypothetical protein
VPNESLVNSYIVSSDEDSGVSEFIRIIRKLIKEKI